MQLFFCNRVSVRVFLLEFFTLYCTVTLRNNIYILILIKIMSVFSLLKLYIERLCVCVCVCVRVRVQVCVNVFR